MAGARPKFTLLHVATVSQSLYYFLDGQVSYMREKGVDVHGVSSPGILLERFAERERAIIHPIDMPRAISPFKDIVSVWRLYRLFLRVKPNIVHAHTPKGGLIGMIASFLARVPIRIYHVHGLPHVTATGLKRSLLRLTERISCLLAHRVFCVSDSLVNQLCDEGICVKSRVRVLHNGSINGVDALGRFNPIRYNAEEIRHSIGIPRNARIIGFVGRLVRDKGVLELVESWAVLRQKFENLHLLLVGPFEDKDSIPIAVRQRLYSDNRVHIMGHVDDPAPYYSVMDVLAFPTHREGFGLVAIEAAAMGVPVVATYIPGCIDSVVDGETGTLIPKGDYTALTTALSLYLHDPRMRLAHGEAGRKRVLASFQPKEIWKALYAEYLDLVYTCG